MTSTSPVPLLQRANEAALPRSFSPAVWLWLLGLGAGMVLLAPINTPMHLYDEGFAMMNATRVAAGEVPYRDFWAVYPPGQSSVLAVVFQVLGTSLGIARAYDTVVCVLLVMSIYLVAARLMSPRLAALSGVTGLLLLASARSYGYAIFPALTLSLLALQSTLEPRLSNAPRRLLVAGALIGLAATFRWDVALYALLSAAVSVIIDAFANAERSEPGTAKTYRVAAVGLLLLIASATVVAVPAYAVVAVRAGFGALWEQVVLFPVTKMHAVRALPYPHPLAVLGDSSASLVGFLRWLLFYFPLTTYAAVLGRCLYQLLREGAALAPRARERAVVALFGTLLFAQAMSRFDYVHVLPTLIVAFPLLIGMLGAPTTDGRSRRRVVGQVALGVFLAVFFALPLRSFLATVTRFSPFGCFSQLPRASCSFVSPDQEQAIAYVRAHTRDEEPIFVGNRRHDLILLNDIGFYFLAERRSATRYHDLFPGVATTEPVQQAIKRDLETSAAQWVVLVDVPLPHEPNAAAVSSGVTVLDDFIRSTFVPVTVFGDYEIRRRRDEPRLPGSAD